MSFLNEANGQEEQPWQFKVVLRIGRRHDLSIFEDDKHRIVAIHDTKHQEMWSAKLVTLAYKYGAMSEEDTRLWYPYFEQGQRLVDPMNVPALRASYNRLLSNVLRTHIGPKFLMIWIVGRRRFQLVYSGKVREVHGVTAPLSR